MSTTPGTTPDATGEVAAAPKRRTTLVAAIVVAALALAGVVTWLAFGRSQGAATGLGLSSFTYVRGSVRLACWHRSVFVALIVLSNLDPAVFPAATAAVDARLS